MLGYFGNGKVGFIKKLFSLFDAELDHFLDNALVEKGLVYFLEIAFAEIKTICNFSLYSNEKPDLFLFCCEAYKAFQTEDFRCFPGCCKILSYLR